MGALAKLMCIQSHIYINFLQESKYLVSLSFSEAYFNKEHEMCYCETCHGNRGDLSKYPRGDPPKDYGLPIGWFRFALAYVSIIVRLVSKSEHQMAFYAENKSVMPQNVIKGTILMD